MRNVAMELRSSVSLFVVNSEKHLENLLRRQGIASAYPELLNSKGDIFNKRVWLHGGPGVGKTVIAAHLIHNIDIQNTRENNPDRITLSFFCSLGQCTIRHILCTFIHQLCALNLRYIYNFIANRHKGTLFRSETTSVRDEIGEHELKRFIDSLLRCYSQAT
jgi:hypothetical protein